MMTLGRHEAYPGGGRQIFTARGAAAAANWWTVAGVTCQGAYLAKGAASYAASLANLAVPASPLAEVVAPTWDTGTGWTSDATAALDTGITPTGTTAWFVRVANGTANTAYDYQGAFADNAWSIVGFRSGTKHAYLWGNGFVETGSVITSGVVGLAGNHGWLDGIDEGATGGSFSGTSVSLYLLGLHGLMSNNFKGDTLAACVYSSVPSDAEIQALMARMAAL